MKTKAILLLTLSASLFVSCGKNKSDPQPVRERTPISLTAAVPESPYADQAENYIKTNQMSLPAINETPGDVTIERILEHTFVQHAWIAENFKAQLETFPQPVLNLLGCTRAFVFGGGTIGGGATTHQQIVRVRPEYVVGNEEQLALLNFKTPELETYDFEYYLWSNFDENFFRKDNIAEYLSAYLTQIIIHEGFHACDEQAGGTLSKTPNFAATESSPVTSAYVAQFTKNSVDINKARLFGIEELKSDFIHSSHVTAYGSWANTEAFAEFGKVAVLKHYFKWSDYIFLRPIDETKKASSDNKILWGMRDKICSPVVRNRAKYVIESVKVFPDFDVDKSFEGCLPKTFNAGETIPEIYERERTL